jgi:multidrug resistance protein
MLWSPLSEMPYIGRMPIYLFTLFLYIVLQVPTALATNFGMLLAFRFITGFVGSPVLATGGATVADIYAPKKQAYGITIWGAFAVCAPAMGPIVGGFAAHAKGWRWTIWELTWLGGFTFTLLFFFFPETSSSNILYRRAVRLRKATGDKRLKSMSEIEAESMSRRDIATEVGSTVYTQFPGAYRAAAQPLYWANLCPILPLVRIIPSRLRRDLPLQGTVFRSRISRHIGRDNCYDSPVRLLSLP